MLAAETESSGAGRWGQGFDQLVPEVPSPGRQKAFHQKVSSREAGNFPCCSGSPGPKIVPGT